MKVKPCRCCGGTGDEIDNVAVGIDMRWKRKASGMSLRAMANGLGFTSAYLSDLENGKRNWRKSLIDYYEAIYDKSKKT